MRLILSIVMWVLAAVLPASLLAAPDEPEGRGHPLSYWLERYTNRATDEERAQAKEAEIAIREIGTNAIPALLAWLRYEPSQTKTDILNFLARLRRSAYGRWVPAALTYDRARVPRGDLGFFILGPAAAEAIPELEQIANDAAKIGPATRAMMALSWIGPQALTAIEGRLSNTNFPIPGDAAIRIYFRTRTLLPESSISDAMARPILVELVTNRNPILAKGAVEVLRLLDLPSPFEKKRNKSFTEALVDLQTERQMGPDLRPGWNLPPVATRPNRVPVSFTNVATGAVTAWNPQGDEPYPYPLLPGSQAWIDAEPYERIESTKIPQEWRDRATSWQMFRSAIANPYFTTILSGDFIEVGYKAARVGAVSILSVVDTSPDFGTNVLRWLTELDLARMASVKCSEASGNEPCWMEYAIVWHMAGLDSALKTLDTSSRQRLFRLAVWDADYFLSRSDNSVAAAPVRLMYVIYDKPESFRGTLPRALALPPLSTSQSVVLGWGQGMIPQPENPRSVVAAAKAALGLTQRP